jgi:zinc transporter ZupT
LLGMGGAAVGVLTLGVTTRLRRTASIGAGLLMGMAVLVLFPEALETGTWMTLAIAALGGVALFAAIEWWLHRTAGQERDLSGPHISMAPLFLAVSIHAMLDGWNVGMSRYLPGSSSVIPFIAAMSVHKLTEGLAIGAIFRTAANSAGWAMIGALASECLTFAGAVAAVALGSRLDHRSNSALLAAAGGGFLYLGWHAVNSARKREGFRAICAPFLAGLLAIWVIAFFSRH